MIKRHWKIYIGVLIVTALVCALCFKAYHHRIRYAGFRWIPAVTFSEIKKSPPFVAVVESKRHGEWGVPVDSSTGKAGINARPIRYVMVYLRREDGKRLCISQENPTPEEVAFVLQLREGEKCSFPTALTNIGEVRP
jgi:hypothetical protein